MLSNSLIIPWDSIHHNHVWGDTSTYIMIGENKTNINNNFLGNNINSIILCMAFYALFLFIFTIFKK